jgi:hypothetical protein
MLANSKKAFGMAQERIKAYLTMTENGLITKPKEPES